MTRYFFHTNDGEEFEDEVGTELATIQDARTQAVRTMAETVRDEARNFWQTANFRLTCMDETGLVLFILDLNAAGQLAAPTAA
jgi:hypothetical protein